MDIPPKSPDLAEEITEAQPKKTRKKPTVPRNTKLTRAKARELVDGTRLPDDHKRTLDASRSALSPPKRPRKLYSQVWLNNLEYVRVSLPEFPPRVLPRLDLRLVRSTLQTPERLSDLDLLRWFKSNDLLPFIMRWYSACKEDETHSARMEATFNLPSSPWTAARELALAFTRQKTFESVQLPHYALLAQHAHRIVHSNRMWFESMFLRYELDLDVRVKFAIAVMLTAWHDIESDPDNSFFGVLVRGDLGTPRYGHVRDVLEMWYVLDEARIEREDEERRRMLSENLAAEPPHRVGQGAGRHTGEQEAQDGDADMHEPRSTTSGSYPVDPDLSRLSNVLRAHQNITNLNDIQRGQALADVESLMAHLESARDAFQLHSTEVS